MNRNYLIVGLCIGLVVGLSVTVGVASFFMRQQAARTSAADARAAAMQAEQEARQAALERKATVPPVPAPSPKEIDIISTTADGQDKARRGIYRIDKGRVFIAMDQRNPARRPKGYITGPNSGIEVMTLERVR